MKPTLVHVLHLPLELVPDYFDLVGMSTLVAAIVTLWFCRRDGARLDVAIRAIALAYAGALVGGPLFESLRAIPVAIVHHSWAPIFGAGRAAWGGLLGALLAVTIYLRARGESVGAFLDRATLGVGIVFFAVRIGCFLAGCDYGAPTSHFFGVVFPPGSLAALDHTQRGWVPAGAASLPVHPTELYESVLALVAAIALVRERRRTGDTFKAWLALYCTGRFTIELFRGDATRGAYLGLSTAQIVSVATLAAIIVVRMAVHRRGTLTLDNGHLGRSTTT